jgi:hypothetical protein
MKTQEELECPSPTQRQEEINHRLLEDTPLVMHRHMKQLQLKPEMT